MKRRWTDFKSPLADTIKAFLAHKRALGRRFWTEEAALRLFDRYLVNQGIATIDAITPAVVEAFLATRRRTRPRSYNHLLGVTRRLFGWMIAQGTLSRNPVQTRPRRATSYRTPFLFDVPAAKRLLEAAERLPDNPRGVGRGRVYPMIFALLFGLGLRVGEVACLCRSDVDLSRRLLIIRHTKFSKSRLVPMGPRLAERLSEYLDQFEADRGPLAPDAPVFSFTANRHVNPMTISQVFHGLATSLAFAPPQGVAPPRLHDLRHSFAVATLLRWYRSGINPADRLIHLSTFLGHVEPSSTAVYLTITAELLSEASDRFERFAAPVLFGGGL
ncbi:MAG: tyrosine-type recombinase/integrase [Deltaproteobacteria bacterium]|nr:tyrosine-type recombinase/integrase [Deltaproteobacteria bacterium]